MQEVDHITCINKGAFVMKFRVEWSNNTGASGWTDEYPVDQQASLDLNNFAIPEGGEVVVEVKAEAGEKKHTHQPVTFKRNCNNNATYMATGTTLDIHVDLLGG